MREGLHSGDLSVLFIFHGTGRDHPDHTALLVLLKALDHITSEALFHAFTQTGIAIDDIDPVPVCPGIDFSVFSFAKGQDHSIAQSVSYRIRPLHGIFTDHCDTGIGPDDDRTVTHLISAADLVTRHFLIHRKIFRRSVTIQPHQTMSPGKR